MILLLSGCTGGLVAGNYPGDALFTLAGTVSAEIQELDREVDYRVSVAWAGGASITPVDVGLETSFPAQYELRLFLPPPDGTPAMAEIQGALVQAGIVVLFDDADGSGSWDVDDEELVGSSSPFVLTWQDQPWLTSDRGIEAREGYFGLRHESGACLDDAGVASSQTFNIQVGGPDGLPDLNCDGSRSEWDGLGG